MTKFLNKKSLGQNFLTNEEIGRDIVNLADIQDKNVLEIGPGKGFLTKYLAEKARKVLAVEIDRNLVENLRRDAINRVSTARNGNVEIVEGDVLKINLPKLIEEKNFQKYKVVANLPYYITSKIIRLFLETKYPPAEMILMVQKEVGERIVALDGKESILSISVKFYAEPEILFDVLRENFEPAPVVDSAVIKIKRKEKIPNVDINKFFSLVRAGFSAKRKMLINNLSSSCQTTRAGLLLAYEKAGLEPTVRAEKLSVEDWVELYNLF
ncbi:MAG TPA: 16S rRNA (adenine(1518)-N(6)/adenine(1519)-N(6))-dimethyltransferase RsmA [Candidatus Bathyarchaeia archaeon]|nr:16S rRNA (adenine(1518)-N(6)/adenine(1519)-N(6))-dimethyltransferase RsmA [Candidatus Bathyarchaeia archaeon]